MDKFYTPTPDGYCGDEDNGQTSAWYVFSALGFYPVCPGSDQYVVGSPLFRRAVVHLPGGKTLELSAPDNRKDRPYIQAARINGKPWTRNYFTFDQLRAGGKVEWEMGSQPALQRGTAPEDAPYSFSRDK